MWNVALHIFPGMIVFIHEFCFRLLQVREVRQSCGAVQDAEGSRATAVARQLKTRVQCKTVGQSAACPSGAHAVLCLRVGWLVFGSFRVFAW